MIKKFDKNGALALYRREFVEYLNDGKYENAIDVVLKYNELKRIEDFHSVCGKLYLLMAQDSDDNELLTMAFREFMLYLRKHPDNAIAHRDILAVQMLRHDVAATFESAEWAKAYGHDTAPMFDDLAEAGIDLFSEDDIGLDIDDMFGKGEFGEIEGAPAIAPETDDAEAHALAPSKVIKFRGGSAPESARSTKSKSKVEKLRIPNEDGFYISEDTLDKTKELLDDYGFFDDDNDDDDGFDERFSDGGRGEFARRGDISAQIALREAERYGLRGDYDALFEALDRITPADGHYHYCAECMRAFTYLQRDDIKNAKRALDGALDFKPDGALAGTLLCKYYEEIGQTSKIPNALKRIDVKDFTDTSHVYQAMRIAIRYCKASDAIALAEQYIDEFNTMDIRMLHAQLLYNSGNKREAARELYMLSRIFYDDFNALYYYSSAVADTERMPIDEEAPQRAIAGLVEGFMWIQRHGPPDDELIREPEYLNALELYLTLEFSNDRKLVVEMFDILRGLASDVRLDDKMRDALVSPYVEPIVKAVILAELLTRSTEFVIELGYCPMDDRTAPISIDGYSAEFKSAFAYVLTADKALCQKLAELAESDLMPRLAELSAAHYDKVYYIVKTLKASNRKSRMLGDGRIEYALGYKTKSAATQSFKAIDAMLRQDK